MADSPSEQTYIITLLRHGESVANAQGYHQGQYNFPLTARGKLQAQAVAKRWKNDGTIFDYLIASPLARARQTAEIIAERLHLSIEFDLDWMERDSGILAGLKHEVAIEHYPQPSFVPPYQRIGKIGESQWELYLRGGRALSNLLFRPPGRYLVVSHGGLLNMVLYAAFGIVPQANFQGVRFSFENTSFAVLRYNPAIHDWNCERINDRQHWDKQSDEEVKDQQESK